MPVSCRRASLRALLQLQAGTVLVRQNETDRDTSHLYLHAPCFWLATASVSLCSTDFNIAKKTKHSA